MDSLKNFLQNHRPDVDDAGCRVAVKVRDGDTEGSFVFSHDWDVYVDQQFLDELNELQGVSFSLKDRKGKN